VYAQYLSWPANARALQKFRVVILFVVIESWGLPWPSGGWDK
jgi:hypothetical protein